MGVWCGQLIEASCCCRRTNQQARKTVCVCVHVRSACMVCVCVCGGRDSLFVPLAAAPSARLHLAELFHDLTAPQSCWAAAELQGETETPFILWGFFSSSQERRTVPEPYSEFPPSSRRRLSFFKVMSGQPAGLIKGEHKAAFYSETAGRVWLTLTMRESWVEGGGG